MKKSYEIDMTSGPLLGKILLFSIPLMLSGILQLLFNAADIIVVGRFAGSGALEMCIRDRGMLIAFVVSIYSIQFLMSYVRKHDFKFFGYYRIILGVIVLAYFGITALAS